jgi:hypothetical protein
MPTNRAMAPNKQGNRAAALTAYSNFNNIIVPPVGRMNQLTARFSSFANTIQTRMNSSNGTGGALGGTLEAQVDRALSQVLRQPGNGGGGTAVATRATDTSVATMVGGAGGIQPAMSPYQATLLREARITQTDFLGILPSLQPLSPLTDPGDVASLQAVVQAELNALLEEFAYTRLLPRQQRVRVLLGGLLGWNYDGYGVNSVFAPGAPAGDIQALVGLLNLGGGVIPTIPIEDQLASQQVLGTDAAVLDTQWQTFWNSTLATLGPGTWPLWEPGVGTPLPGRSGLGALLPLPAGGAGFQLIPFGPGSPQLQKQAPWRVGVISGAAAVTGQSYAERIIRADLLLPVIAQDATRVEASLTAVGFSAGEQETQFAALWSAVDADLLPGWDGVTAISSSLPVTPIAPGSPGWLVLLGNLQTATGPATTAEPIPVWTTVADVLDWAQNLAGPSSSDQLRQAGALGLNLICDQADELFWLTMALLDPTATAQISALADSEVQLELLSLATDLNLLANLAY